MKRNNRTFWYCLYDGEEAVKDSDGNDTGEVKVKYKAPVKMQANISAGSTSITYGSLIVQPFGVSDRYDRVIVVEDAKCPIKEDTVLFVEHEPSFASDGSPLFDYVIKKAAFSLNGASYAILRVRT